MQNARGILSCASCRQRKLRCDRGEPCHNCETRKIDCKYAPIPRGRAVVQRQEDNRQELEGRIRHLEKLIGNLASQNASQNGNGSTTSSHHGGAASVTSQDMSSTASSLCEVKSGRMIENDNQMIYVSPDHWAAIHDEITKLRAHVESDDPSDAEAIAEQVANDRGLMLLEGLCPPCSLEEIVFDIPPRPVADRLVSKYFTSRDRLIVLHGPNFLREYRDFWNQPTAAPPAWVAMLFGVMLGGAFLYVRSGEALPEGMGSAAEVLENFQRRSAECLVLSNYSTAPGKYTLEALLLHGHSEFIRRPDAQVGIWVLGGVATRLALRMGYHRDPSHYPHFTPFEGEMRRRMWLNIRQLDSLTSYQVGLPSMLQDRHIDCLPPRNIFDEEISVESTELPPSRPESEITPITYQIVKVRILSVFSDIFDQTSLIESDGRSYDRVAELDRRLTEVLSYVPEVLRLAAPQDSLMVHPHILIRQYNIELLGQKARCILHRQHMTKSFQDSRFDYSRKACLTSAMALLKYQLDILAEVQPGGLLFNERWFVTQLEHSDFLLACMVVLLEVSRRGKANAPNGLEEFYTTTQLMDAVKKSQDFWYVMRDRNRKAMQAYKTMSGMLSRIMVDTEERAANANGATGAMSYNGPRDDQSYTSVNISTPATGASDRPIQPAQTYEPQLQSAVLDPGMAEISDMLISPALVDWVCELGGNSYGLDVYPEIRCGG